MQESQRFRIMPTQRSSDIEKDLKNATEIIRKGGIILYPTDTVWGIGCDATNPEAVKRIYDLKRRDDRKSMLVLTDSQESLKKMVRNIPEAALSLMGDTEEPLTIIYENPEGIAPNLVAQENTLGIRITKEDFSRKLCERLGVPVVSTSANVSGEKTASCFREISREIKDGVDYVVAYRQDDETPAKPSRIVMVKGNGDIRTIR